MKSLLLLCALVAGSGSAWAEDPNWSYTVVNGDASKLNTTAKTFTVDASHVWSYDGTTVAAGTSPSITIASYSSTYGIKFGESGSKYYSPVILSTSAFNNVAVTKVRLYLKHNGKKSGTLTVKQGDVTIGTKTTSSSSDWISVECSETNKGLGGTLTIQYEVAQAIYINKIEVWYETLSTDPIIVASDVNYAADITAGSISYSITNPVDGKSLSATTTDDWITVGTVTSSAVSFTMTENTGAEREGTITLKYDGATDKTVTVTQAAAVAKYAVTFTAPSNGTLAVKRDGTAITSGTEVPTGTDLTIEATPVRGYSLTKWEYKEGEGEWTDGSGTSYTVASSTVAFRATFAEITKYTVTLGDDNSTLTEEYGGEGVTLPSRSAIGNTFVGWATASISTATTTAPTLIPAGVYLPTEDITLYPVYGYSAIGTVTNYKRVSALSEVTEGTYVMGSQKDLSGAPLVYMPNAESSGSNPTLKEGIAEETISSDVYLSNEVASDMLWDFISTGTGTANQYYIRPHGSTTIGLGCTTSGGANVRISSSYKDMKWTIANSTDYNWQFKNDASTAMYLAVYDKYAWRNYNSSSTNQNGKFYLYKAVDAKGVVTYYTSSPTSTGTITMNAACNDGSVVYGTYYTDRAYVMPENMVGQVVKVDSEGKLVVQDAYEEDNVVPAGTALLLYTIDDFTGTKNYTINYSNEDGTDWSSDNMLKGTLTADETTTGDNCLFYRLTMHNGTNIGFWWGAANGAAFIPGAHKAYLAVSTNTSRQGFSLFGDEPDGIDATLADNASKSGEVYNLQGQRVGSPTKGLYIVNGKKIVIK